LARKALEYFPPKVSSDGAEIYLLIKNISLSFNQQINHSKISKGRAPSILTFFSLNEPQ